MSTPVHTFDKCKLNPVANSSLLNFPGNDTSTAPCSSSFHRSASITPETPTDSNTPLVRLGSLSDKTGCEILAKAEWMNPGGSVKDRAAKYLIMDAEKKGVLKPGGTVVEGTAGNTGIGLAHMCRAKGYKCVIYIPETQSKEKMDALR